MTKELGLGLWGGSRDKCDGAMICCCCCCCSLHLLLYSHGLTAKSRSWSQDKSQSPRNLHYVGMTTILQMETVGVFVTNYGQVLFHYFVLPLLLCIVFSRSFVIVHSCYVSRQPWVSLWSDPTKNSETKRVHAPLLSTTWY